jgi:ABC-type sugar transport system substrate-binding protein
MKRFVVATAAGVLLLSACSAGEGGEPQANQPADGTLKIGFAVPASNQTYWTAYINSVKELSEAAGVEVTFADAKDDANAQVEQVASFVTAGVNAIVLVPVDTVGPKAAVEATVSSGIPLITSNRLLEMEYGGVDGAIPKIHTGFDDVTIGKVSGELLAEVCKDKDPCNVVRLTANLGSSVEQQRSGGQDEIIAANPNIKLLDSQPDNFDMNKANEITASWLQKFDKIDALICQYDEMCIAASDVIKENGRDGIQIVGVGGSKNGIAAVEAGNMYGTARVSAADDGKFAFETIVKIAKGEAVTTEEVNGVPTVPVPVTAVNKENAADNPGDW